MCNSAGNLGSRLWRKAALVQIKTTEYNMDFFFHLQFDFLCSAIPRTYVFPVTSNLRKPVSSSRYCIERVFRPRKLDRFHPKELLECAFDIVTSTTNSSLPTAETIYTIYEVIQEFPALQVPFCVLMWRCSPLSISAVGNPQPLPPLARCWSRSQLFGSQWQRVWGWCFELHLRLSPLPWQNWWVGGRVNVVSLPILVKLRNEAQLPVALPLFRTLSVPPPSVNSQHLCLFSSSLPPVAKSNNNLNHPPLANQLPLNWLLARSLHELF